MDGAASAPSFDWVREPVLNPYTRLAVAMCPAEGVLRVLGYDRRSITPGAGDCNLRDCSASAP